MAKNDYFQARFVSFPGNGLFVRVPDERAPWVKIFFWGKNCIAELGDLQKFGGHRKRGSPPK